MTKRRIALTLLLAAFVVAGAWAAVNFLRPEAAPPAGETWVNVPGGKYTDVTTQRLSEMLADKDFVFINTHIPYEGEIAGTDAFIAYDRIAQSPDRLPAERSAKIVLYCRSGRMSTTASETLVELGYTHVYNLAGGMSAWRAAGLPILEDGE